MPDYRLEAAQGGIVCGIDEAGRGPWAGPVVAGAVVLDIARLPASLCARLDDSKKLTARRREALFAEMEAARADGVLHFATAAASVEEIDRLNILRATYLAMGRAVAALCAAHPREGGSAAALCAADQGGGGTAAAALCAANLKKGGSAAALLPVTPTHALVDGNGVPPGLPCAASAVVGGDGKSLSIAAASIAAKVCRDRLMAQLDAAWPGYGFARNAGYGTAQHRAALMRLGVSPHHRRSFAPIRRLLERPQDVVLKCGDNSTI